MTFDGFLGTRAGLLIDVALIYFVLAPFLVFGSIRIGRHGGHKTHRNLQAGLFGLMIVCVLTLEVSIRSGGTMEALSKSVFSGTNTLTAVFVFHLLVAVSTFVSWLTLAILSWKRFGDVLPGVFSRTHKLVGKTTFVGLCLSSLTGTMLYVMGFAY